MCIRDRPYSNVVASSLKLDDELWHSHSIEIRRAHECAHMFTLNHYGKMEHHIFDELVADYVGITSILGVFDLTWFLHFMGLEKYPDYRKGGRFQNYVPNLSDESRKMLQSILVRASGNLEKFDSKLGIPNNSKCKRNRIKSLCETSLLVLASDDGLRVLLEKYESFQESFV